MDFLTFLPSILKGVTGLGQLFGGLFAQPKRPTYEIPTAATQSLDVAKRLAGQTELPGQKILETQLGEKTANMTRSLERMGAGGAGLGALANIYGQQANQQRNLAVDAARYYVGNQQNLQGALNNYAQWQAKQQDYNKLQKYNEQAAASSALTEAGIKNTITGASDIAGTAAYGNLFKNMGSSGYNPYMGNSYNNMYNPFGGGNLPFQYLNPKQFNYSLGG